MSELKQVRLSDLKANPHRDGKRFPLVETRLALLQESIKAEGFWEGIIAREVDVNFYEIAFGHHRIEAARRVLGKGAEIPIIIRDLSNTDMLRFMERENIEDSLGFYYINVQVVCAAVRALAAGQIKRGDGKGEWPEEASNIQPGLLRQAPGFEPGKADSRAPSGAYSLSSLARFLGNTVTRGEDARQSAPSRDKAAPSIVLAVAILEMLERGYVMHSDCAQLTTQAQFETVIQAARLKLKAKEEAEAVHLKILEEAKQRYANEKTDKGVSIPNKAKIEKVERQIEVVKKVAARPVDAVVRRTVKDVVGRFESGSSVKEVREQVVQPIKLEFKQKVREAITNVRAKPFTRDEVEASSRLMRKQHLEDFRDRVLACTNRKARDEFREEVAKLQARLREYSKGGL